MIISSTYADARRLPHCVAIAIPAKKAGRGRFSATANQTLRCTTSTPKMRCSRRPDTHSGFACYSCSRFTTRSLYAMRAQTSRRGSPMCTVMQWRRASCFWLSLPDCPPRAMSLRRYRLRLAFPHFSRYCSCVAFSAAIAFQ